MLFVERFGLQQPCLVGPFSRRIIFNEFIDCVPKRRIVRAVKADQTLILRIFGFIAVWIFVDDLAINIFGFLVMTQLSLAVAEEQHHFGADIFRDLILTSFMIGNDLRKLTGLVPQTQQPDCGDCFPVACLGQRPPFLQEGRRLLSHCVVNFTLVRA